MELAVHGAPPIYLPEPCISQRPEAACQQITGCSTTSRAQDVDDQWIATCRSSESFSEDGWTRGAVWKGGELLARELLARPDLVRGMRVVEVGTGTGIVGLAAAAAGARAVTLTDQSLDAATATLRMNPTLADRVSLRTLRWGDHEGGSALSPPFEVIIAADVIHPQNAAALEPLLSSVRTLVGGGGSRYPFVLLSYVERSDKLTHALAAALSELPARCRRRPLGRRAWLYELDMWDNWPSGQGCAEKGATGITAWPVAGKQAGPDRILPGFRRSFNRPVAAT